MRSLANTALPPCIGRPASGRSKLRSPAPLPPPETYEAEYGYWPWGKVLSSVASWVTDHAHHGAVIFDYMCGTGYLLARIADQRPDLHVEGCDIHGPFVSFARRKYPQVRIHHADALRFDMLASPDIILCTAGLHHLTFDEQLPFIDKLCAEADQRTTLLIAEEAIGDYRDEQSRRLAALAFDSTLIALGVERGWPPTILDGAIQLLQNDVMARGEYKRSEAAWRNVFGDRIDVLQTEMIWQSPTGGGDLVFVCRKA